MTSIFNKTGSSPDPVIYTCPMHPEVKSQEPGKCPKCGMFLVPRRSNDDTQRHGA